MKTVKVAHGEMLAANDIPETPVKEGYEFVGWVYGIDGMYTFAPTSNIASCYYLTASWKEASETPDDDQTDSGSDATPAGCNANGCGGIVGSISVMTTLLTAASIVILKKKEN